MTAALEGGEWSAARPGRTLPPGKTQYPFYRRLGGPQVRSGRAENLVPTGILSRTVQPVAQSLYRWSYPAHTSDPSPLIYNCKDCDTVDTWRTGSKDQSQNLAQFSTEALTLVKPHLCVLKLIVRECSVILGTL